MSDTLTMTRALLADFERKAATDERERIMEVVSDKYMVIAYWFQTMPPSVAMGQLANLIDPAKFDDFSAVWQEYQDAIKGGNK